MSKTKLQLMEESLVSMLDHCMGEAWVECRNNLPDVVVHNMVGNIFNWTVHGRTSGDNLYRLDFIFSDEDICQVEWEQGTGVTSWDFPNQTEERFLTMAGMALAFQSDVLNQIQ